ncbi:DUF3108 domain-containing protein [Novimethylophilus kurashikiensis]|nr:DUF3108 domain-containing protein [Novimethylophilus kurashikiensis]
MKTLFLLLLGLVAATSAPIVALSAPQLTAPQKVTVVYEATRDGKPFAKVNETFSRDGSHYRIESVTSGIGVYALLGKRHLTSDGEVTAHGLKPHHFELQQGDNSKKKVTADFDWEGGKLTMTVKSKANTVDLEPETQDLASFPYQFMFQPPAADEIVMPVTTGKRVRTYRYQVTRPEDKLDVLGGLKVIKLANAGKDEGDDDKEFWLAVDKHFVPARIVLRDDNGARIEQVLTSLSIE